MEGARFSPHGKSNSKVYCYVNGCQSNWKKNPDVRFHHLPRAGKEFVYEKNFFGNLEKVDKLKAWKNALKMVRISNSMRVCSLHFKKTDYILPDVECKIRHLKKNAVPSCNLPDDFASDSPRNHQQKKCRLARINKCQKTKDIGDKAESLLISASEMPACSTPVNDSAVSMADLDVPAIHDATVFLPDKHNMPQFPSSVRIHTSSTGDQADVNSTYNSSETVGVQVNTDFLNFTIVNLMQSNSELSTATGLESFSILNVIVEIVTLAHADKLDQNDVKMSLRDKIILTYTKLKQNCTYCFLALLFRCTAKHAQRIFSSMINVLSGCLKPIIRWPSKNEILKNMPTCFEPFQDTRVVVDCTEIFVQHSKNLCCQTILYSYYKKNETVKFLTGVTPAGNISFISEPFGGRASNTEIFQQCNLQQLLEPGDAVMVDREFLIQEICAKNRWKMIRPPLLKSKHEPLNNPEATLTARISKARGHIERLNQRIKTFKILGDTLPVNLVPLVGDIFTVVCATINLSSPILEDNEFMDI